MVYFDITQASDTVLRQLLQALRIQRQKIEEDEQLVKAELLRRHQHELF